MNQNKYNSDIRNRRQVARANLGISVDRAEARAQTKRDLAMIGILGVAGVSAYAIAPIAADAFTAKQERNDANHQEQNGIPPLGEPTTTTIVVEAPNK